MKSHSYSLLIGHSELSIKTSNFCTWQENFYLNILLDEKLLGDFFVKLKLILQQIKRARFAQKFCLIFCFLGMKNQHGLR